MPIENIHTYLVHPGKGQEPPYQVGGAEIPLAAGKLLRLMQDVYETAEDECSIGIMFNQAVDGRQQNDCRDLVLAHLRGRTLESGRSLAERLASFTTKRSGLGLLFLLVGKEGHKYKIVISRFPANSAISAEETTRRELSVQFLERVFMRSTYTYKAVVFSDRSLGAGFWQGGAVDKQINSRELEVSNYWVRDFLAADFRTTSAAGTRRLAVAMRDAARKSNDPSVRREIAAAATLGVGLDGQSITIDDFASRMGLSDQAREAITKQLSNAGTATDRFQFDREEFVRQVPYRSMELDTGAILTAASPDFDEVFEREREPDGRVRFSTVGEVVSEKLEKMR